MELNSSFWRICSFHQRKFQLPFGFPTKAYYINYVFACIVNVILTLSTISLNTITILAYWRSKQLKRKTSLFLIILLSTVDLATGLLGNSSFTFLLVKILMKDPDCNIYMFLEYVSLSLAGMSFMTLFLLNFERYLSIVHPFFYRRKITKCKLFILALLLWSCAIASTLCRLFLNRIGRVLTSIFVATTFLAFIYIYATIYCTAQMVKQNSISEHKKAIDNARHVYDIKLAKSCALIVGCTFLCVIPFAVISSLAPFTFLTLSLAYWSCTLGLASSSFNSLIFFWRNSALRTEAKLLLFRKIY